MCESAIEKYLVACVKALGGECRKLKWIGRNSAPDRLVLFPGRIIWVEVKAYGKKPTAAQIREHTRLRNMGQTVEVIDSYERVDSLLK